MVDVGATVNVPPLYGKVYDVPFEPVTWIEAALVSVTVRVTCCPDVMLLELALIETVGSAAEALAVKVNTPTKVKNDAIKGPKRFISSRDVHSSRFALWCDVSRVGSLRPGLQKGWTGTRALDAERR